MKQTLLRAVAAVFTFIIGVSSACLTWVVYRGSDIPPLVKPESEIAFNRLIVTVTGASSSEPAQESIEEEWRRLLATSMNVGGVYYDPTRKLEASGLSEIAFPLLNPYTMLPSVRRDKQRAVEFLLKQIPDKTRTDICMCPFGFMPRGELAVYFLQHILKVNWYELNEEYRIRYHHLTETDGIESQNLLGRIIKSRRGAKEMQALWQRYYKQNP